MKRSLGILVCSALMASVAAPASARVPDKTPRRLLEARMRRQIASGPAAGATPGVIVQRGPRTLLEINPTTPLAPASLLKLATTVAAITKFGPDHRFVTQVRATARVGAGGVLAGPLYLVGGGDPTLAHEQYRQIAFVGRPKPDDPHPIPVFDHASPTIEQLARAIVDAGVRRVDGDLLVDDTLFDSVRTQRGWLPNYTASDPETGFIDALTIDEGFTDPLVTHHVLAAPAISTGSALRSALAALGVSVRGTVKPGITPKGAPSLARVQSPPLADIVFYTNRWSINYDAEFLLKHLGASFGGAGTTAAGAAVVLKTLQALKISVDGLLQEDGSGLSLLDRVEPATIAALLRHILALRGLAGDAMRRSLPVAAGPGTLFKRFRNTPAAGNLRGKTGTVRHVRSLAGWVTPLDGVPIVYVLMFNDVAQPSLLTSPLDFLGVMLTQYPRN